MHNISIPPFATPNAIFPSHASVGAAAAAAEQCKATMGEREWNENRRRRLRQVAPSTAAFLGVDSPLLHTIAAPSFFAGPFRSPQRCCGHGVAVSQSPPTDPTVSNARPKITHKTATAAAAPPSRRSAASRARAASSRPCRAASSATRRSSSSRSAPPASSMRSTRPSTSAASPASAR